MSEFIANPTKLIRYRIHPNQRRYFEMGRVAMALEIVTQIRVLEEQTMYAVVEVAPIIAALHTLLTDAGLDTDELWNLYERLSRGRRLFPIGKPNSSDESHSSFSLPRSVAVDDLPQHLRQRLESSSPDASPEDAPSQEHVAETSSSPRLSSDPSGEQPEEASEEDLRAAYERGKDLGLLADRERSRTRWPRKRKRARG